MDERLSNGSGLLKAVNERDYDILDEIMAPDFVDNHPGFDGIQSAAAYKEALKYMHKAFDMKAEMNVIFSTNDQIVTRVTLLGKHIGEFMGIPATGKDVNWTTIEVYQVENNKLKSRLALDDMVGLYSQIGVNLPS